MTFSLVGHCERTGMFGVSITTSSICVGSRCPWVRAGVGAVATQNVTDPALGNAVLDLIEQGEGAAVAIERVIDGRLHAEHRQLTAVDRHGGTAHFTGARILGKNAVDVGTRCVAAGNLLATQKLPAAMTAAFASANAEHIGERLLRALEAGVNAGGEEGTVHSAALLVADRQPWPVVNLRVDWHDTNPIAALRVLWEAYRPQIDDYVARAANPDAAPSYGVPGDP